MKPETALLTDSDSVTGLVSSHSVPTARVDGGKPAVLPVPGQGAAHALRRGGGGRRRAEPEPGPAEGDEDGGGAGQEQHGPVPGLLGPPVRPSLLS